MKAIGRNLIIEAVKQGVAETKGGLLLAERQREDIRYEEAKVISIGDEVIGIKKGDIIYFDKNNSHQIEIKQDIYSVVRMDHIVVVL
jgi:co-chaperonin GroES (HSP10)|tara:strand:+ start:1413 stop:1673 length:261 start_codon:yes stop_codon:yes gene_type:complete